MFRYRGLFDGEQEPSNTDIVYKRTWPYISSSTREKLSANRDLINNLMSTLDTKSKDRWSVRIESDCVDIYTNEKDLFNQLSERFERSTIHRFEPHGKTADLLDAGVYVVKKYPFDQYQYKVFLAPHKLNRDQLRKQQFVDWLELQGDKIKISDTVKEWFISWNFNWDRRYMYVDNEQTLLMLKMRESQAIGRVYKYVLADK
jgi:hypothetical protein